MKKQDGQEVGEITERNRKVAAFFDLDGTLLARPSLERQFFARLRYRRVIGWRNYFACFLEALRLMPTGIMKSMQANKMYLRGMPTARGVENNLLPEPVIFEEGLQQIAWHAKQGHAIVFVSGTLEFLAKDVALSFENELMKRKIFVEIIVCATQLEAAKECWTGRLKGEPMFGEAKAREIQRMAREKNWELRNCFAYGDSLLDRWMLDTVGKAIALNPDAEIKRLAMARGWGIVNWNKKKELTQRTQRAEEQSSRRSPDNAEFWSKAIRMERERLARERQRKVSRALV